MSEDIRVIIIKFADRMHNLATLEYVGAAESSATRRWNVLRCTHPIAHRLGMRKVKEYMEDVSLKYLDPVAYKEVEDNLEARAQSASSLLRQRKK